MDREGPHPESSEDPVGAAQEEAQWSAYTNYVRATNQGKFLFPTKNLRGWRRVTMLVLAAMLLVVIILGGMRLI